MKEELEKLKANSVGKLKAYNQPIPADQMVLVGDLLCSYVIEDGFIIQGVLTISHKDRCDFKLPEESQEIIANVFGSGAMFLRDYPSRGFCMQYAFRGVEGV